MTPEEQVLAIERTVLEQSGMFQGVTFDTERFLSRIFAPGVARFMPRAEAEVDATHKQLIPYVMMASQGKYLSYVRGKQGGEKRLVGNRSIGIGGHINPADDLPLFSQLAGYSREAYLTGVEREVNEEVSVASGYTDTIVALLNDDSTEVGRVHLGIVHYWELATPSVNKREQMITQLDFLGVEELHRLRDSMETWSQLCVDHLPEMARRGASGERGTLPR